MSFFSKIGKVLKDALEFYVENEDEIKETVRKAKKVVKKVKGKKKAASDEPLN